MKALRRFLRDRREARELHLRLTVSEARVRAALATMHRLLDELHVDVKRRSDVIEAQLGRAT